MCCAVDILALVGGPVDSGVGALPPPQEEFMVSRGVRMRVAENDYFVMLEVDADRSNRRSRNVHLVQTFRVPETVSAAMTLAGRPCAFVVLVFALAAVVDALAVVAVPAWCFLFVDVDCCCTRSSSCCTGLLAVNLVCFWFRHCSCCQQ